MALLLADPPNGDEAISSTITGLTTGIQYQAQVYWQQATVTNGSFPSFAGGSFDMTINGVKQTYTSAGVTDSWNVATLVFTATASTATLKLQVNKNGNVNPGYAAIVVDDAGILSVTLACTTPATPSISATNPTCSVSTGSVTVASPVSGVTYTLSPGGTTSTTGSFTGLGAGTYTVTATNGTCVSAASNSVTVSAQPATPSAPTFGAATQPTCAVPTGTINLTGLPASGTWTLTRSGTSSATLTGSGTTYANTGLAPGNYTYTVTNASGCVSTASATQTINAAPAAPTIATPPAPQSYCAGGSATFTVTPSGTGPFTYQWQVSADNGANWYNEAASNAGPPVVSGGTSQTLTYTNIPASFGSRLYRVVVGSTTGCGSVTSTSTTLTLNAAPTIATPPAPQSYCAGGSATFTVTPSGTGPFTYQWQVSADNGANWYNEAASNAGPPVVSGGTSQTLTYTNIPASFGSRLYRVVVGSTTGCGSVTSTSTTLTLNTPSTPTFGAATQPTCAVPTGTINLTGLPASGTWTLTRSGTSSATLTGSGTTYANTGLAPGNYTYTVTNASGCVSTASATQTINAAPAAPVTPTLSGTTATNACPATTANLSALVTSTAPSGATLEFHTSATPTAGNLVSTPGAVAAGTYYAFYLSSGGCYSPASAAITVTIATCGTPDLTPIMTVLPSTVYGTTNITIVTDVYEVNSVATTGPTSIYISKDALITVTFNSAATFLNGKIVQNSAWTFDAVSNSSYYILTTTQSISGGGKLSFGLNAVLTPGATTGAATVSSTILGGSGGETNAGNNTDSEKINYFAN
ncbi:hypothetical protein GCM10028774_47100 [Spirosoma jeollabukense]